MVGLHHAFVKPTYYPSDTSPTVSVEILALDNITVEVVQS